MELNQLWEILSGYPTGIYTVFIGLLLVFWLFVIIGALDLELISFDADIDVDAEIEIPGFVGLMHTLGLTGVPFTIVITILVFLAWVFSYIVSAYLIPLIPSSLVQILVATITLVGAFLLAVPITSRIVAPLQKLSQENQAKSNKDFLGSHCTVTSLSVDDTFGQGKIKTRGASLIVRIRAELPNTIKKGDIVRPISYDENDNVYHIVTHEEFEKNLEK
ncbi:OB-fold-containig protein [sulfur-oxidizing endosymbiont of Gigantopelta aegis]|uniref:OB-fold-containig protein n=1 Tax=sulfur-oxidizing endosymbiont of Gigantopelta aegis TaxID=2794934 RepID=UPI0018DEC4BE|nr:OB-fold-containig protein [sulfur-oxidizing endosymbiont of Gigantopelta aegis]